jgi:hypothetical protein
LTGAGSAKDGPQNLERQGFGGQNLENKELMVALEVAACTASALTMICFFSFEVKVGCHTMMVVPVDFFQDRPWRLR